MSKLAKAAKLTLGVPTVEQIEYIAGKVRQSDRQDMEGLNPNSSIFDIIMGDVALSRVVYGLYLGNVPHAVFGVIPGKDEGVGIPWVVGTEDVERNPLPFARGSLSLLEMLQKKFPLFETFICTQNRSSLLWHRWCGFEIENEKIKLGRDLYYRAVRRIGTKFNRKVKI